MCGIHESSFWVFGNSIDNVHACINFQTPISAHELNNLRGDWGGKSVIIEFPDQSIGVRDPTSEIIYIGQHMYGNRIDIVLSRYDRWCAITAAIGVICLEDRKTTQLEWYLQTN